MGKLLAARNGSRAADTTTCADLLLAFLQVDGTAVGRVRILCRGCVAAGLGIAQVIGADVAVLAVLELGDHRACCFGRLALFVQGALVVIVALLAVSDVLALAVLANVCGALVAVFVALLA